MSNEIKSKQETPSGFQGLFRPRSRKEIMKERETRGKNEPKNN